MYRFDGVHWVEEAKLTASDGHSGDQFGRAVSLGGDLDGDGRAEAVVGVFLGDPDGRMDAGNAYVYTFEATAEGQEDLVLVYGRDPLVDPEETLTFTFVVEPAANIMLNVTPIFRLGIGASYRAVESLSLPELTNDDLSGFSGNIQFKFGMFTGR